VDTRLLQTHGGFKVGWLDAYERETGKQQGIEKLTLKSDAQPNNVA